MTTDEKWQEKINKELEENCEEQPPLPDKIYTRSELLIEIEKKYFLDELTFDGCIAFTIDETLRAERAKIFDFFNLTVGDLPAFPPKSTDLTMLYLVIGQAKMMNIKKKIK